MLLYVAISTKNKFILFRYNTDNLRLMFTFIVLLKKFFKRIFTELNHQKRSKSETNRYSDLARRHSLSELGHESR